MKLATVLSTLLAARTSGSALIARQSQDTSTCADISATQNNGDRKIGLVIDASGSMSTSDPNKLRSDAAKSINDWLLSSDEVTLVRFDNSGKTLYPLGDPSGITDQDFKNVYTGGSTNIDSGVKLALNQIKDAGSYANSSGIVVLTDGVDDYTSYTNNLLKDIKACAQDGIRVSIGYLASSISSTQPNQILAAILETGGTYSTIANAQAQTQFVNLVLTHGLTDNDNADPDSSHLLNGISISGFFDSTGVHAMTYAAKSGENLQFNIQGRSIQSVTATLTDSSGNELDKVTVAGTSTYGKTLSAKAPGDGDLMLNMTATNLHADPMYIVGVSSNLRVPDCSLVNPASSSGLSNGAKAGIGVGVTVAILGLLGAGGYFYFKHFGNPFHGMHNPFSNPTPSGPHGDPSMANPNGTEKGVPNVDVNPVHPDPSNMQQPYMPGNEPMHGPPQNPPMHNSAPPPMNNPSDFGPPMNNTPAPPPMSNPTDVPPIGPGSPPITGPSFIPPPIVAGAPPMSNPKNNDNGPPMNNANDPPPMNNPNTPPPKTDGDNQEPFLLFGAGRRRSSSSDEIRPPSPLQPHPHGHPGGLQAPYSPPPMSDVSHGSELPTLQHQVYAEVPGSTQHREHIQQVDSAPVHEMGNTSVRPEMPAPHGSGELPGTQHQQYTELPAGAGAQPVRDGRARASDGHTYQLYDGA